MSERNIPTSEQFKNELIREQNKKETYKKIRNTFFGLVTVAAVAILVATLWLPVLQVVGTSMEPTLNTGQIVVAVKNSKFDKNDIVAFYYNNNILLKRVIGTETDIINIDEGGNVYVNGVLLEEDYVSEKDLGECDIEFPYQVPEGQIFVLGDHRATSIDSRSSKLGCISEESIVGEVFARIWPLNKIKKLN